jgi:hypothetical protein
LKSLKSGTNHFVLQIWIIFLDKNIEKNVIKPLIYFTLEKKAKCKINSFALQRWLKFSGENILHKCFFLF